MKKSIKKLRLFLLSDVPGTGMKGEIQDVAEGFARNFLLPQKQAVIATASVIEEAKEEARKRAQKNERELKEFQRVAERLDGQELELTAKATAEGTLYAAISPALIAETIQKRLGFRISASLLRIPQQIKRIGDYTITAEFSHGIEAEIIIHVIES